MNHWIFFALIIAVGAAPGISHAALEMPNEELMKPLQTDGLYRFTDFKEFTPKTFIMNGKTLQPSNDEITYVFRKDEPVRVEYLKNGIVRITRGMNAEDLFQNSPSQLDIPFEQFRATDLRRIDKDLDLHRLYADYLNQQSQEASRKRMRRVRRGGGNCSIDNWGTGQCVTYIKMTEGISGTLGNGGAVAATLEARYGYRGIPCTFPPQTGTIASWRGHVAKWDGSCWRTLPQIACACNNGDPGRGRPHKCVIKY